MGLTGFEHRLLAHNTFTFNFSSGEAGIENVPVSPHQLNGILTLVLNGDPVCENIVVLAGTGISGLIFRLNTNLDTLRDFRYHTSQKYQFFGIPTAFLLFAFKSLKIKRFLLFQSVSPKCFPAFLSNFNFVQKGYATWMLKSNLPGKRSSSMNLRNLILWTS
jgi:hypothetical protein